MFRRYVLPGESYKYSNHQFFRKELLTNGSCVTVLMNTKATLVTFQRGKKLCCAALPLKTENQSMENLERFNGTECPLLSNKKKYIEESNEMKSFKKVFSMKMETNDGFLVVRISLRGLLVWTPPPGASGDARFILCGKDSHRGTGKTNLWKLETESEATSRMPTEWKRPSRPFHLSHQLKALASPDQGRCGSKVPKKDRVFLCRTR